MKYRLRSILALIFTAAVALLIFLFFRPAQDNKTSSALNTSATAPSSEHSAAAHVAPKTNAQSPEDNTKAQMRVLEWVELMPPEDLALLEAMTPVDHASMDETELAKDNTPPSKSLKPQGELSRFETAPNEQNRTWKDALVSKRTRAELNQQQIKIAGFIVPLTYNSQQQLTDFFLVPYFGACIHVPPPPPNQIIYVRLPQGMPAPDINIPVWLEGRLKIETLENDLGVSSYSLDAQSVLPYTDE
jgi:hypothetical protein